ncbi:MAG TPA: sialidase family protein [Vicinamibacterales bacterium]
MASSRYLLAALGLVAMLAGNARAEETRLPCRQPQLAAADSGLYLACGAAPDSILVARSTDGAATFTRLTPITVPGALALGNHRGPRVAASGRAVLVSAIVGTPGAERGTSGNLMVWRSDDDGRTWSAPVVVNDVPNAAREGLHGMALQGNRASLLWLDLRTGRMRLMSAASTDGGRTWGPNRLAYDGSPVICTCCHPSVLIAGSRVVAMFRNDLNGARDMYVIESTDGGTTWGDARRVGTGTWPITMCPMDGGAIALDRAGDVIATWRREGTVYVGGVGRETRVGDGVNPALALAGNTPVVVWNASEGLAARWGDNPPQRIATRGQFASAASLPDPDRVVVAYEDGAETVVRVLAAPTS